MKKISPFFRRIAAAVLVFAALQGALQATAFAEPPTVSDGAQPASPADGEKKPALTLGRQKRDPYGRRHRHGPLRK